MDFNGNNRGYAFVVFSTKKEAQNAVRMLNNYEVRDYVMYISTKIGRVNPDLTREFGHHYAFKKVHASEKMAHYPA